MTDLSMNTFGADYNPDMLSFGSGYDPGFNLDTLSYSSAAPVASTALPPASLLDYMNQQEQLYNLPSGLLASIAQIESGFNPNTPNGAAGEVGMMQLLPSTAAGLGVNPYDPYENINGAAQLMSKNLQQFGSLPAALSAYNSGSPTRSPGYAQKVMSLLGVSPPGQAVSGAPNAAGGLTAAGAISWYWYGLAILIILSLAFLGVRSMTK
ncbi:MAG: transglycosylase SLT domain-containing protein [Sphingomonadales bacterium]|nr:transglycosylase SLT domain-containing protein [Sphingomonadales bacterium]